MFLLQSGIFNNFIRCKKFLFYKYINIYILVTWIICTFSKFLRHNPNCFYIQTSPKTLHYYIFKRYRQILPQKICLFQIFPTCQLLSKLLVIVSSKITTKILPSFRKNRASKKSVEPKADGCVLSQFEHANAFPRIELGWLKPFAISTRRPVFVKGNFPDPTMKLVVRSMEGYGISRQSNDSRTARCHVCT